jgi:hypothetical protein
MTAIVIPIDRNDTRFDSVKETDWFATLPDSFFEYVNTVTVTPSGVAYCNDCQNLATSYMHSVPDADYSDWHACAEHIHYSIAKESISNQWRRWHSVPDTIEPFLKELIAVPAQESIDIEQCVRCNTGMYNNDIVNQPSWSQGRYRSVVATNNEGKDVVVHRQCTYKCIECNESFVLGGTIGVSNVNVNNALACIPCWDKLQVDTEWTSCNHCGTYIDEDDVLYSEARGASLCNPCYEMDIECDECGYCYYEDDGHTCEDDDPGAGYVHSYSYKPRPIFFGQAPYHLGLELEVEAKRASLRDGAEHMYGAIGERAYLKYDGSLSDGFEIVTHPHSLDEIQSKFPWYALQEIQEMGFRSWNTSSCGIHVHVSRNAFKDDAHQIKFTKLIYDNQRQVERLAGRKSSYAKFNDKGRLVAKVKFGNQSDGRYSAVNNENENTLEVRVFRGSLRKERILSAIEFVHAAVEYTRNTKVVAKDKPLSWARFIAFVVMNHQQYPNLLIIMGELFEKENEVIDQEEVNN